MHVINNPEQKVPILCWCENPEQSAIDQAVRVASLPFVYGKVCLMPDTHMGYGLPIGGVVALINIVSPAMVGVDIGCFSGDTLIPVVDGIEYSLKEMAESKKSFLIFACDENGKITIAESTSKLTRQNAELLLITLDNGKKIKCTPDHKFLLRNGQYKQANLLTFSDSLMPLYLGEDKSGYLYINQVNNKRKYGRFSMIHRIVANDLMNNKKKKIAIHHKDANKHNNYPENLEIKSQSEHSCLHAQELVKAGKHHFQTRSKTFEEKRLIGIRKYCKTEEGRLQRAKTVLNNMNNNKEKFLDAVKNNGKRGKLFLQKYNASSDTRKLLKKFKCIFCGTLIKSESFSGYHYQRNHRIEIKELLEKNNHKVISILPLSEREDVYCLTVPQYHNFALSAGVFVHNCGMTAIKSSLQDIDSTILKQIMKKTREIIPLGRNHHKHPQGTIIEIFEQEINKEMTPIIAQEAKSATYQLGSLGGGNHFIEFQKGNDGFIYIMLHSGSRNLGKKVCDHYCEVATELNKKWYSQILPEWKLSFLPMDEIQGKMYWEEMNLALLFAFKNRKMMITRIMEIMQEETQCSFPDEIINIHHNYATQYKDNLILHRKGATDASIGTIGLIPGSQGTSSYIVKGKGNPNSYESCSHGAGRKLGRMAACRELNLEEEIAKLDAKGVIHAVRNKSDLEEAAGAYKDIEICMKEQEDLVEILVKLEPLAVIKE